MGAVAAAPLEGECSTKRSQPEAKPKARKV